MRLVYRPGHPSANENGLVDVSQIDHFGDDARFYVISDTMDPLRHMANGKHYTSKREFREATKAAGCVEYGSETAHLLKPRVPVKLDRNKRREDIRRTIYDIRNGIRRENE
jgi:hypothetical protein